MAKHSLRLLLTSVVLIGVILLLTGCYAKKEPEKSEKLSETFVVETLFTYDGCTVYRFMDTGYYRYYSKCTAAQSTTTWSEGCGKGCSRSVEIETRN